MSRTLVTSSRFSPGNMTPEALESMFVGRAELLNDALERLKASATGRSKHFLLLVGPRGCGKTHFVALLHHRLRTSPDFADVRERAHVVFFNEEEWGIASFLDLLVRILDILCESAGSESLRGSLRKISKTHEHDPEGALRDAQALLTQFVGPRTLILICENLAEIFHGIGVEGQNRWRALMHEHPFWTVLATTPRLFSGVQLRSSPFYGTFTVRYLHKLDFGTATSLLVRKARLEGRRDLADFLGTATGRARARAIHHLAGGNPRVYIILSDFLTRQSLDDLVDPFLRMADDLTPYYQDRIRQLAPRQRKIVEFLCRTREPVVIKEIADRCFMSQQTASKQLSELANLGLVDRTRLGKNTYCELAEPLMRICIEVKDTRTRHLRLFVDFLRHWFSVRELRLELETLYGDCDARRQLDRMHLEVAVREYGEDRHQPFLDALDSESRACFENGDFTGLAEVQCRLVEERGSPSDYMACAFALRKAGRIEESVHCARNGVRRYPDNASNWHMLASSLEYQGSTDEALGAVQRAVAIDPQEPKYILKRCALLWRLGRCDESLTQAEKACEIWPGEIECIVCKGDALLGLDRREEALEQFDKAIAMDPRSPEALSHRALSLLAIGRCEDALECCDRLLEVAPQRVGMFWLKAMCLLGLDRRQEAEATCRESLNLRDVHGHIMARAFGLAASALARDGLHETALQMIDRAVELDPKDAELAMRRCDMLIDLGRYGEAAALIARAIDGGAADGRVQLKECIAVTGLRGLPAACERLEAVLAAEPGKDLADELPSVVARMLIAEVRRSGPVAMARQIPLVRNAIGGHAPGKVFSGAIAQLLQSRVDPTDFSSVEWQSAAAELCLALADLEDCEIALKMLSVAVRYSATADESVLLELPLEQRSLLTERFRANVVGAG